jgi:hypothetical protein
MVSYICKGERERTSSIQGILNSGAHRDEMFQKLAAGFLSFAVLGTALSNQKAEGLNNFCQHFQVKFSRHRTQIESWA